MCVDYFLSLHTKLRNVKFYWHVMIFSFMVKVFQEIPLIIKPYNFVASYKFYVTFAFWLIIIFCYSWVFQLATRLFPFPSFHVYNLLHSLWALKTALLRFLASDAVWWYLAILHVTVKLLSGKWKAGNKCWSLLLILSTKEHTNE